MKNLELTHIFSGGIGALRLVFATLFLGSCTQSDDQERERLRLESVRKHLSYGRPPLRASQPLTDLPTV